MKNSPNRGAYVLQWAQTVPWMIYPPFLAAMAEIAADVALALPDGTKVEAVVSDPSAKQYRSPDSLTTGPNNSVAVIGVRGAIFRYADWFTDMCGGATVTNIARDLRAARDDPKIRAIILEIDSPGGEVAGISELGSLIRQADEVKPTWAYGDGDVCSAAYWLGAAAKKLIISPTALVGSVGTVCSVRNPDYEGDGVIEIVSTQSPMKRPDIRTEEGLAEVQSTADGLTDVFITHLAESRGVTREYVAKNFGRGGLLIGAAAVAVNMADEIGTFDGTVEAILAEASERAGAKKEDSNMAVDRVSVTQEEETPRPNRLARILQWVNGSSEDQEIEEMISDGPPVDPAALGLLASKPIGGIKVPEPTIPPVQVFESAPDPRIALLEAQIAELSAEREKDRKEALQKEAVRFSASLVRSGKVEPFEQAALIETYLQAEADDRLHPITGGTSRLESFKALHTARTAQNRTAEAVPVVEEETEEGTEGTGLVLLENVTDTPKVDPNAPITEEEREKSLAATETGRRVLAMRRAAASK